MSVYLVPFAAQLRHSDHIVIGFLHFTALSPEEALGKAIIDLRRRYTQHHTPVIGEPIPLEEICNSHGLVLSGATA